MSDARARRMHGPAFGQELAGHQELRFGCGAANLFGLQPELSLLDNGHASARGRFVEAG